MKREHFKRTAKIGFWALLLSAYSVGAAGVMIDVFGADYRELGQVAVTSVDSKSERRSLSAAQIAAVYRAQSGAPFSTLPPGSTFKVVWPDGSSEYVMVVSPSASGGVQPIPGTQVPAKGKKGGKADDGQPRNVPGATELTEADVQEMAAWMDVVVR
ncbi:hypothetical protein A7A76_00265 [Lysobacter enzymogenes]|uniref:hypothetical protein n=1 Tax=Lysobacter enzymogenes TaxID=69 RepID=UPI0031BA2A66|nr:hypothetical protein [Lysobacter enzymogenes]